MRCFASLLLLLLLPAALPAELPEVRSELFSKLRLVYEDTFDEPELKTAFWEVRQGSTWKVADGLLTGGPAPKAYQDQKIAEGDKAHAGLKPVIWLKKVPETFVCAMRVRYDGSTPHPKFPLIDVGHHIHTLIFGDQQTTLILRKKVATVPVNAPLFALNQWHDVRIELKKGVLILSIDGVKHRFEHPSIDMVLQSQIDFKGLDGGTCQIDHLRVWEGRE